MYDSQPQQVEIKLQRADTAKAGRRNQAFNTVDDSSQSRNFKHQQSQSFNARSNPPRAWINAQQGNSRGLRKMAVGRLMPTGRTPTNAPLISC